MASHNPIVLFSLLLVKKSNEQNQASNKHPSSEAGHGNGFPPCLGGRLSPLYPYLQMMPASSLDRELVQVSI